MAKDKVHTETVEVEGDHLLAKIKEIVHEGNVSLADYYLHPLQPLRMVAGGDCQYSPFRYPQSCRCIVDANPLLCVG